MVKLKNNDEFWNLLYNNFVIYKSLSNNIPMANERKLEGKSTQSIK